MEEMLFLNDKFDFDVNYVHNLSFARPSNIDENSLEGFKKTGNTKRS